MACRIERWSRISDTRSSKETAPLITKLKEVTHTMKKLLPLLCALGCLAQPALAANNINALGSLGQSQFKDFSEDLGSALSYKPVTPAAPLGIIGFDVGLVLTKTDMAKSSALWNTVTSGGGSVSSLYVPKLSIAKGLPFNVDIAGFVSKVPTTNVSLYGAELRYAILEGGLALPAVAVRGAFTKLAGVSQLSLNTKSLDVSISKGFAMFTPYAGVGQVWTTSTPHAGSLTEESFTKSKIFAGGNLNLGLINLAAEFDKTGSAKSISAKMGFRF